MRIKSYKDLIVWQKSIDLAIAIYELTENYPDSEKFGLTSDTRKTTRSISYNIAEGRYRSTRKDFRHFLRIAFASGAELETQIIIAKRLPFGKHLDFSKVDSILEEVMKMLNKMLSTLES